MIEFDIVNREAGLAQQIARFAHAVLGKELIVVADIDGDWRLALSAADDPLIVLRIAVACTAAAARYCDSNMAPSKAR
jgi:hypothetical protein